MCQQNKAQLCKLDALLVSNIISRFVEPVRLFPTSVKAHRCFVLQQLVNAACPAGWSTSEALLLGVTNWRHRQSEEETAKSLVTVRKRRLCPMNAWSPCVLLTHIVEAIGFSNFDTHERHIRPFAVAVGVAFNQVVRRFSIPDPVTQELTDTASMDDSIPKNSPSVEHYESFSSLIKSTKVLTNLHPPHLPKANGSPVVANSTVWSDHGQWVRCICDWSRHDVDDVSFL